VADAGQTEAFEDETECGSPLHTDLAALAHEITTRAPSLGTVGFRDREQLLAATIPLFGSAQTAREARRKAGPELDRLAAHGAARTRARVYERTTPPLARPGKCLQRPGDYHVRAPGGVADARCRGTTLASITDGTWPPRGQTRVTTPTVQQGVGGSD
jgi:hypothetical protein